MFFRAVVQVLVVAALASGCGWHLRGSLPLPEQLQVIAVASEDGALREEMVSALEASGAEVVPDLETAQSVLDLYDITFDRRVRTISTRGKVSGYVLRYDIRYRVVNQEGETLRETRLAVQRDYNFDPEQVLQAEEEEEQLRENMVEELARRIMRQLVTIAALTIEVPGSEERASA